MSIRVINAVWEHSKSQSNQRLVLLAIADNARHDGTDAFPDYPELMRKTLLSERTIRDAITRLEDLGELDVEPLPDDRRKRLYRVILPGLEIPAETAGTSKGPKSQASDQGQVPKNAIDSEKAAESAATSRPDDDEKPAKTAGTSDAIPADDAGSSDAPTSRNRQIPAEVPADSRRDTGEIASHHKEEPSEPSRNLPVGASTSDVVPKDWNASHVLRAVIKPGERIPEILRKRLAGEIKKLADEKGRWDFDLVCSCSRRIIDEAKTPSALSLLVLEAVNGKGSGPRGGGTGGGQQPWRAPDDDEYGTKVG